MNLWDLLPYSDNPDGEHEEWLRCVRCEEPGTVVAITLMIDGTRYYHYACPYCEYIRDVLPAPITP